MSQLDLFARATDPDTSHGRKEWLGDAAVRVLLALIRADYGEGATAPQVQLRMSYDGPTPDRNCISRRLTSLVRHGLAEDTGARRDGGHGVAVIVFAPTTQGRAFANERDQP